MLPPPLPLRLSERSTVDSNGGIPLLRVEDCPKVRLVGCLLSELSQAHSALCECLQLTLANLL